MVVLTVNLPDPLVERVTRESRNRGVTPDAIVQRALEFAFRVDEGVKDRATVERLMKLVVDDPESPTDLATNPAHMEGFGISHLPEI